MTHHIFQPLDDVPFANFKQRLSKLKKDHCDSHLAARIAPKSAIQRVAVQAFKEAFTFEAIKHAFEATGLYPFNKDRILSRAREVLPNGEKSMVKSAAAAADAEMALLAKTHLGLLRPLESGRKSTISQKNKLFTGSELVAWDEQRKKEEGAKEAEKQAKKQGRLTKKHKRDEEKASKQSAAKRRKIASAEVKKRKEAELTTKRCQLCTNHNRETTEYWWTCPTCNNYKLCRLHAADVAAVTKHESSCQEDAEKAD